MKNILFILALGVATFSSAQVVILPTLKTEIVTVEDILLENRIEIEGLLEDAVNPSDDLRIELENLIVKRQVAIKDAELTSELKNSNSSLIMAKDAILDMYEQKINVLINYSPVVLAANE